jgi:hypothetical protein
MVQSGGRFCIKFTLSSLSPWNHKYWD